MHDLLLEFNLLREILHILRAFYYCVFRFFHNCSEPIEYNAKTLLVFTNGYYPGEKYAGITTSRENLVNGLISDFNIYIVTTDHDYKEKKRYENIHSGWNKRDKTNIQYLSENEINVKRLTEIIDEVKPKIIYTAGFLTTYFEYNQYMFEAARRKGVSVIDTPDGDIMNKALQNKSLKKKIAIKICKMTAAYRTVKFQVTSEEERSNLISLFGIASDSIVLIPNMPCYFDERTQHSKNAGSIKLLYCARIHPHKGLLYAIRVASRIKGNVEFDVYGEIEDQQYYLECLKERDKSSISLKYKGRLPLYKSRIIAKDYDLMFLPTKGENYCYTIEESLMCGCPVLISKGTTPWDDVYPDAGFAEDLNNIDSFVQRLQYVVDLDSKTYNYWCRNLRSYVMDKTAYYSVRNSYVEMFKGDY